MWSGEGAFGRAGKRRAGKHKRRCGLPCILERRRLSFESLEDRRMLAALISEILFDPPGTDPPNEYVEIRGTPNETLPAGTYLVCVEGDGADNMGGVQTIIHLGGLTLGSNGFLVLLQSGSSYAVNPAAAVLASTATGFSGLPEGRWIAGATHIAEATATFLLIQTATPPTLSSDIDSNDDGIPEGAVWASWTILDSVGVTSTGGSKRWYGSVNFINGNGIGLGEQVSVDFTPAYVGRRGNSMGFSSADWLASVPTGTAPNLSLGPNTEPASMSGLAMNHVGGPNFVLPAVDNGDAGFSTVGDWSPYLGQGHDNDVHFAAAGDGSKTATWTFSTSPGRYRFAATWTTHANRATNARFTVSEGTTELGSFEVNQELAPDDFTDGGTTWEYLGGTYDITGSTVSVRLSDAANQYVIADAVSLQRVANPSSAAQIQVIEGTTQLVDGNAVPLSYGTTFINAPLSKTFRVKNVGQSNLTLQGVTAPSGFTVVSNIAANTVLISGAETTFVVRLDAASFGAFSGEISFANSDGDENPFNFVVSGTVAGVRIIDNGDVGFNASGGWQFFGGEGFQADVHAASPGAGNQTAVWSFPASPGRYRAAPLGVRMPTAPRMRRTPSRK